MPHVAKGSQVEECLHYIICYDCEALKVGVTSVALFWTTGVRERGDNPGSRQNVVLECEDLHKKAFSLHVLIIY